EETRVEFDPERATFVKERLSTLYRLLQKHRLNDIKELLDLQRELEEKSFVAGNLDTALARAKQDHDAALAETTRLAMALRESRKKTFQPLQRQIVKLLRELGIPDASLLIETQE